MRFILPHYNFFDSFRMPRLPSWWYAFVHLFYPQLCVACNAAMPSSSRQCFCFSCRSKIEPTTFHESKENDISERLWGRLPIESAAALYYFDKKGPVQLALHHLKYKNQPDIGKRLGRLLGTQLYSSPLFQDINCIVPVPLHPKKERKRGYNQSMAFALGLADALQLPVYDNTLARQQDTVSQTNKHRMERFQNVGQVFLLKQTKDIAGKHVLLVDDVLTTGATLEFCGNLLLSVPGVKISIATIAVARN
ncbi:MAG: ComF family protein [Chitinophagales bacterium]